METHHIITGKVVSSPTDSSWAQAYSAGKLYVVLSLEGTSEQSLAALGKDTIEKLQREFFALDEKSLASIKKSVETVHQSLPSEITTSLVLVTVVDDAVYILIGNAGQVVLKRGGATSVIAIGQPPEISVFSGKFEPQDEFLLATSGFSKAVSMEQLEAAMKEKTPHEAIESLAPVIHENSKGSEAGLLMKLGEHAVTPVEAVPTEEELEENNDHLELGDSDNPSEKRKAFALPYIGNITRFIPRKLSRKQLIAGAVVVLLLILGGGILFENNKRQQEVHNAAVENVLSINEPKYEEAMAVIGLNKSLATEELQEIKTEIEKEIKNIPEGSAARNRLKEFLAKVINALGGQGSTDSPISIFLDQTKESDIKPVLYVTNKGGTLSAAGGTKAGIISENGTIEETFETANAKGIASNEDSIYVLSTKGVQKIDKESGDTEDIFDANGISIDTFGENVYVLEGKTINKYAPSSYAKGVYLTGNAKLTNPSSIAIDSSIYVVDDSKIKKFTRGAEDSFDYNGPTLSNKSLAYTDEDYANLYVVDPVSQMAYVIDKSGNKISEFSLKGMKTITGVSADEAASKMYVTGDGNIYVINI